MRALSELSIEEKRALYHDVLDKEETGEDYVSLCQKYQLNMHPDTLRRASIGIRLADEIAGNEAASDGVIERQKMRDMASKVNAIYRTESRSELLR